MRTTMFLLNHTSAPVTESIVVGALMGSKYGLGEVQLILDRATDLLVTRKMVHTAAQYCNPESFGFLLKKSLHIREA